MRLFDRNGYSAKTMRKSMEKKKKEKEKENIINVFNFWMGFDFAFRAE